MFIHIFIFIVYAHIIIVYTHIIFSLFILYHETSLKIDCREENK